MTKIILKPLRRVSQLKKLTASNCMMRGFDGTRLINVSGWLEGRKEGSARFGNLF